MKNTPGPKKKKRFEKSVRRRMSQQEEEEAPALKRLLSGSQPLFLAAYWLSLRGFLQRGKGRLALIGTLIGVIQLSVSVTGRAVGPVLWCGNCPSAPSAAAHDISSGMKYASTTGVPGKYGNMSDIK